MPSVIILNYTALASAQMQNDGEIGGRWDAQGERGTQPSLT
jgi:hypothetical protein